MTHSATHHKITNIGRHKGRSSTAAAAYRTGLRIVDERSGEIHDYTRRDGVLAHFNIGWADGETAALWNAIEEKDTRREKVNVARETTLALPHELPLDEQVRVLKGYTLWLRDKYGCAATVAIHAPGKEGDKRNIHAHILETTRKVGPDGSIGEKIRVMDDKRTGTYEFEARRAEWAKRVNRALEKAGVEKRVEHKSLSRRYIDDENAIRKAPVPHYGPKEMAIARRRNAEAKKAIKAGKDVPPLTATQKIHLLTNRLNKAYEEVHHSEAELGIHEARKKAEKALAENGTTNHTTSLWEAIGRFVGAPGLIEYCHTIRQRLRGSTSLTTPPKAIPLPSKPLPPTFTAPDEGRPVIDFSDRQMEAWKRHREEQAKPAPATVKETHNRRPKPNGSGNDER